MTIDDNYAALLKTWGIGLTGGVAMGKSTVADILREKGHAVIDADQLARKAVERGSPGLRQIVERFGNDILQRDGQLDRKKMRSIVFNNAALRQDLEAITHPEIARLLKAALVTEGLMEYPRTWFYEAPLLFEVGRSREFREVWVCYCSPESQLKRLKARDNCDDVLAKQIIESQMPAWEKRDRADVVIDTDQTLDTVRTQIDREFSRLKQELKRDTAGG